MDGLTNDIPAPQPEWAIVEIFGHRSHAGRIQEVERFGTKMLRIDVPGDGDAVYATHFYGGASIFSLRPCTEEAARKVAEYERPRPYASLALPAPDDDETVEQDEIAF